MKSKTGSRYTASAQASERPFSGPSMRSLAETRSTFGVDVQLNGLESCVSQRMDALTCRSLSTSPHDRLLSNTEARVQYRAESEDSHHGTTRPMDFPHYGLMKRGGRLSLTRKMFRPSWAILVVTLLFSSFMPSYSATVPHDFNDLSESPLEPEAGYVDRAADNESVFDTELSAKEFLGKFGYVRPAEWTSVSPRFFGDGQLGFDMNEGESKGRDKGSYEGSAEEEEKDKYKESNIVRWSFEDISEEEYQSALIKYQRINGLNATGELDDDTKAYMGKPRCGVPDRTAIFKVNRTIDLASPTTTTASPTASDPTTASDWTNATTGYWINSNFTDAMDNGSDATTTVTADNQSTVYSTELTPADDEASGEYSVPTTTAATSPYDDLDMDGSGDFEPDAADQVAGGDGNDLLRKRRSAGSYMEDLQFEAGFEHGFHIEEDTYPDMPGPSLIDELSLNEMRTRRVEFKDLNDAPISEAVPDDSRVTDMQGILEALRREKLSQMNATMKEEGKTFNELVDAIRPTPAAPLSGLMKRIVMDTRANRRKRSNAYQAYGWQMAFPKRVITWRLVDEWGSRRSFMTPNEIWFTVKLAFRMWSEIIPRHFREDNTKAATDVDILIGFGRGEHNRCLIPFNTGPFTQEYAHAWPLPQAEIHFNDNQRFVSVGYEPSSDVAFKKKSPAISLLKVATHEIGHTLGLPHKKDKSSVMNPVYIPYQSKKVVELETVDRVAVQSLYGSCNMEFDAVFDWVRQEKGRDGVSRWKYNTFFFRNNWFWLYENGARRPRYGDPKYTVDFWRGVLNGPLDPHRKIDGIVNIRDWSLPNGPIYFFTGDTYTQYDNHRDKVMLMDPKGNNYPRPIKEGFPGIPDPIDTVLYKWQEGLLYFFKGSWVYKFDWRKNKVVSIEAISKAFPGWGGAAPLPNNINAAYYSYTDSAYYFFKGIYYWKIAGTWERLNNKGLDIAKNAVGPRQLISSKWKYICDVDITEMQMTLPLENQAYVQVNSAQG